MEQREEEKQSIELLQQLGLKEYEAKSFVALSRLQQGTAREISDISEVPRTRVYDSIRVLESKGLVEIHHSNPKEFRTVSIDEAVQILKAEYTSRIETLEKHLNSLEPVEDESSTEITHEVWALSGSESVATRARQLISNADGELIMVIGHERVVTSELLETLQTVHEAGIRIAIGTVSESLCEELSTALPDATVFVSELGWLTTAALADDTTEIELIMLIDRETILASSTHVGAAGESQAVFGQGFNNGLVTIVRRLLVTGLLSNTDANWIGKAQEQ